MNPLEDPLEQNADFKAYVHTLSNIKDGAFDVWDYGFDEAAEEFKARKKRGRKNGAGSAASGSKRKRRGGKKAAECDDVNELDLAADEDGDDDDDNVIPTYILDMDENGDDEDDNEPSAPQTLGMPHSRVANEDTIPGYIPALPYIFIKNFVMTCFTGTHINLDWILQRSMRYGFYRNKKKFAALVVRCLTPRTSTLAFFNGKFVNTGAKKESDAELSINRMIKIISNLRDEQGHRPYSDMRIVRKRVHNVVGSTSVPFHIDLKVFARFNFVRYVQDNFVGAIVMLSQIEGVDMQSHRKVKALVFKSGNIVIMGAKSIDHIKSLYCLLYPYLARAAVQDGLPVQFRVRESQLRRTKTELSHIQNNTSDPGSMIAIDQTFQVEEFRRVNENRPSGTRLLELEAERNPNSLAHIDQRSRNMIAIHTMAEEDYRREAVRSQEALQAASSSSSFRHEPGSGALTVVIGEQAPAKKRVRFLDPEESRHLALGPSH